LINTIYKDICFDNDIIQKDIKRLNNQIWKLIPMRENGENWKQHIIIVVEEITGLQKIFDKNLNFLIVLSKLNGLIDSDIPFIQYRKIIFDILNLCKGV